MFKAFIPVFLIAVAFAQEPAQKTFHGWLSDEQCARARAASGTFTATDPVCAKRCVAEGKKIVFIDPNARVVMEVANQDAARANVGDEVEVVGSVDARSNALHIDSLKQIACGVSMCSRKSRR